MKKYFLILLIFIIGCETIQLRAPDEISSFSLDEINLATDKELYHSGEMMHIAFDINSPVAINNLSVRFYGIHAGNYRLDQTKIVNLTKGENTIRIDYNAPSCYGCAGISPGIYQISADVIYDEEILTNTSVDIEIQQ